MERVARRGFLKRTVNIGIGLSLLPHLSRANDFISWKMSSYREVPFLKEGEKQIFVDEYMITNSRNIVRKIHPAGKLEYPVLEADMPWEQGDEYNGEKDRRVYIYGTVLWNEKRDGLRMWYNRLRDSYYATSKDGIHWNRPNLGIDGNTNKINLFDFHSPSFIIDKKDPDPAKRYKAIGSRPGGYCAAYSEDGLRWNLYDQNPVLLSSDTITLSQDPVNGEYLAFHKRSRDPRVRGRQVFLSVSKDMQNWSAPEPVMVTDEIDHQAARELEGGTHSEFYNMSAFPYGNQWLGFVTRFRRTGIPKVIKNDGQVQSHAEGPIDVQLVHSRDGRKWERCSDRSPIIPLGPHEYDSGSILGLCNSPVIINDEVFMYYTAMTTSHGGYVPDKQMSIALAKWRLDGMVSLHAGASEGFIETQMMKFEGNRLIVNANVAGKLLIELVNGEGEALEGYGRDNCTPIKGENLRHEVIWKNKMTLPDDSSFKLRFYLTEGDLFSYYVE